MPGTRVTGVGAVGLPVPPVRVVNQRMALPLALKRPYLLILAVIDGRVRHIRRQRLWIYDHINRHPRAFADKGLGYVVNDIGRERRRG